MSTYLSSKTVLDITRGMFRFCLAVVLLLWSGEAQAGQLADRMAQFPNWESKPPVTAAQGDLIYPAWMEGTWNVTSTLVEQVAPLAPEVVTPGFESNRRYLNQPVSFLVRFQAVTPQSSAIAENLVPLKLQKSGRSPLPQPGKTTTVVADREFNGLNIGKAYLGDRTIQSVKVDPNSPNRQITFLRTGRQLISIVTGRAEEMPAPDRFIGTEVSNQIFRGIPQPYLNQVETTTAYQRQESPTLAIEADQVTAIYLSPQDADYFKALERPVALYRYRLELTPVDATSPS
ncbi:DUF6816 family protein [Allocoleopsis sp.]|uniref:DUF6816 family protein n=1 Tax=Allocoleopsis sp. TaxID=3088169 RepID=UPI002FD5215D